MKFGVVVFPGSNCDHDAYYMVRHILNEPVDFLWHKERDLKDSDIVILPGGFSYGDYLRAGAIARFSPIMEELIAFARKGGLIIGICNGFQILIEAGLLPGALIDNAHMKFRCQQVYIRVSSTDSPFTSGLTPGQVLKMPVAHHAGNYFVTDEQYRELAEHNQIAFQYCSPEGVVTAESNPNGSVHNIAGVLSREKNVMGMMPHPERATEKILGSLDGLKIFQSLLESKGYAIEFT